MRCSEAFILLAFISSTQVSGLNLEKLKTSSVLNSKKYDDANGGKCKNIKCPSTEELVCVKLRTSNGYSQKNIFVVVINRCELEYMKCHEELEAIVVPMKYCLHKKASSTRKVGSNKRVKRSPDIAARASQDNNLAPKDFRKNFAGNKSPKINYNLLYYGPRNSRKDAEKNVESVLEDISADPNSADDQGDRNEERKEAFLLTIDATNADQYSHLTKDNREEVIDGNNDSSNGEDARESTLDGENKKDGEQLHDSRQTAEETEDQSKESFNGDIKKENGDTDNEMPAKENTVHSLSQKGKLSQGSNGTSISVVINYGRPDDGSDSNEKRLMDRNKSGENSVEQKDQETSHVESEEVIKKQSEEQRSQETSPVAPEEASEQPIVEQKEEDSSAIAPEEGIEEPIVEQKDAESSPMSSEKVKEEPIEKQNEEETSPVASEEVLEEHSGELKPDEVVTPKGPPDSNIEEENPNENSKNRDIAANDKESDEENYMINFEPANNHPDYEEVDIDEYKSDCPSVCPSRDVMVCARCKEGVYRTFMSVCHLRMFNCKHPEEKLELVSRKPCMLSAPFLNDMPKTKGRVAEPGDRDPVLQYLRCKGRNFSNDPSCQFAAANDETEDE